MKAPAGGFLEHLDDGPIAVEADDLAQETGLADAHQLVQHHVAEGRGLDESAHDTYEPGFTGRGAHRSLTR